MILGQTTRGLGGETLRLKLDAVTFGWFYPFFFVGTGIKFDVAALGRDLATALMVPAFLALMLVIRGAPCCSIATPSTGRSGCLSRYSPRSLRFRWS